jgi:hypothetical protein
MKGSDLNYDPHPEYRPFEMKEHAYGPYEQTAFRDVKQEATAQQMHNAQAGFNKAVMPDREVKFNAGNWAYVGAGGIIFALVTVGILAWIFRRK